MKATVLPVDTSYGESDASLFRVDDKEDVGQVLLLVSLPRHLHLMRFFPSFTGDSGRKEGQDDLFGFPRIGYVVHLKNAAIISDPTSAEPHRDAGARAIAELVNQDPGFKSGCLRKSLLFRGKSLIHVPLQSARTTKGARAPRLSK